MAKVMIFSEGNYSELYIDDSRVIQGIEKVSFTAKGGEPAKMELVCDVNALKIEKNSKIGEMKDQILGYMNKFSK